MRPSPQPTASRLFTVLLTVLLISSLVAPFAAGPVVADDGDDADDEPGCLYEQIGIPWFQCDLDDPVEVTSDETMIHTMARAEAESMDAHYTTLDNQLTDTNTMASLEARHAIAQSWEDGDSESQAYANALEAIRDYYAVQQENHLAQKERSLAQQTNAADAAYRDDEVPDEFLAVDYSGNDIASSTISTEGHLTNDTITDEAEFVNGETYEYTVPVVYFRIYGSGHWNSDSHEIPMAVFNESHWTYDDDDYRLTSDHTMEVWHDTNQDHSESQVYSDFRIITMNVGDVEDGGLASETVYDNRDWLERWYEIEHQSDQVVANYDQEFVEALYAELDAGRLDPEDVRGAEGMARYLSGDSNVTSQRFQLSLMQMSGMSNPDLAGTSSMSVEYEGYTDLRYNGTDSGERVPELSDYTEDTFEGLLFASQVPAGGFETGQTYAVGDVNTTGTDLEPVDGSVQIFDAAAGETTHFYEGTFTVTEMYDADGNEVDQVDWDQPQYDTYNASDFVAYIEEVQDLRDAIEQQADDGGDDEISIGLPDWDLDDVGTGEALVGLVIIVVVAMAIIGLVTDLLPWF